MKKVREIFEASEKQVGEGISVWSPLPNARLDQLSPFLMLDHFGPTLVSRDKPFYVPPHPHKGFEPVTLLFKGEVLHRDSLGNTGHLQAGDVQWMTAGRGLLHSEGAPDAFLEKGGEVELIQLWVNLPRAKKNHAPRYQDIRSAQFPVVTIGGGRYKVLAGSYNGEASPIELLTPVMILHGRLEDGQQSEIAVPEGYTAAIYTLSGHLVVDHHTVPARQLVRMDDQPGTIAVSSTGGSQFIVLTGRPIEEPVASYGPFVMNSKAELMEALDEYRSGKMGTLEA